MQSKLKILNNQLPYGMKQCQESSTTNNNNNNNSNNLLSKLTIQLVKLKNLQIIYLSHKNIFFFKFKHKLLCY